jgi:hypothetical protein
MSQIQRSEPGFPVPSWQTGGPTITSACSPCSACSSHPEAGGRASRRGQRGLIISIRLHTPGPWTVDYTDDNLRIYAGDLLIGEVNGSTEHIDDLRGKNFGMLGIEYMRSPRLSSARAAFGRTGRRFFGLRVRGFKAPPRLGPGGAFLLKKGMAAAGGRRGQFSPKGGI